MTWPETEFQFKDVYCALCLRANLIPEKSTKQSLLAEQLNGNQLKSASSPRLYNLTLQNGDSFDNKPKTELKLKMMEKFIYPQIWTHICLSVLDPT